MIRWGLQLQGYSPPAANDAVDGIDDGLLDPQAMALLGALLEDELASASSCDASSEIADAFGGAVHEMNAYEQLEAFALPATALEPRQMLSPHQQQLTGCASSPMMPERALGGELEAQCLPDAKLLAGEAPSFIGVKRKAPSLESASSASSSPIDAVGAGGSIAKCPRSRNREYIEQLKQEVADLVLRVKALSEAGTSPVRELELGTCVDAVTKLMTLRFAAVPDPKLWNVLVTPEFELQLPAGMLPGLDQLSGPPTGTLRPDGLRSIRGINQVMQDVVHLQQFLKSILLAFQVQIPGQATPARNGFHLLPSVGDTMALLSGDTLMANWTLTVETLADYSFVVTDGMLDCKFAPDGRIEKLTLIYDLLSLAGKMQEFRRAKVLMQQAALAALHQQQQHM